MTAAGFSFTKGETMTETDGLDEATLAEMKKRADRMEVLLADSHPDSEPCTLLCEAAADVYDDQRALRREVRRLSAALADANKTIRALAAAPSGEPDTEEKP